MAEPGSADGRTAGATLLWGRYRLGSGLGFGAVHGPEMKEGPGRRRPKGGEARSIELPDRTSNQRQSSRIRSPAFS
jgi:hypothetical protein